jgi:hypothetical protein
MPFRTFAIAPSANGCRLASKISAARRNRGASTIPQGEFIKSETVAIHGGYEGDPTTHAVAVSIYQTVAYSFDSGSGPTT